MIRVDSVQKRFGPVTAVEDLSFEVLGGETFALIGPNGAGKTTTLKMILGLVRPDRGSIELGRGGFRPADPRARHGLGYVPQRTQFPPARTVVEVLRFFSDLRGLPRDSVSSALERVGLGPLASRRAEELSGGYLQRLALAQALLGSPSLLVLDEPTASLDPEATWEFRSLVEQLQREGATILLCSHLLSEVERIADRVLILVQGRRAGLESLAELRTRQVTATRLVIEWRAASGEPARGEAAVAHLRQSGIQASVLDERRIAVEGGDGQGLAALECLRGGGFAIRSFEIERPTLEELFLAAVRTSRSERTHP